jgi:23S rRNA-intervening sequence protein
MAWAKRIGKETMSDRRNRNRGYKQLRVWEDAIDLYSVTCRVFRPFPYELRRVSSQAIAGVDSVHRNIAEGYCRRCSRGVPPLHVASHGRLARNPEWAGCPSDAKACARRACYTLIVQESNAIYQVNSPDPT